MLPEAGDTVVVAFEYGDVNRPFVLGGFWNAAQRPPQGDGAGNDVRLLRSRSGHVLRLDDTDGAERIEIVDKSGRNTITIDTAKNKITVHAAGPVAITADGDLELTATGDLKLGGRQVTSTAELKLALSGTAGRRAHQHRPAGRARARPSTSTRAGRRPARGKEGSRWGNPPPPRATW